VPKPRLHRLLVVQHPQPAELNVIGTTVPEVIYMSRYSRRYAGGWVLILGHAYPALLSTGSIIYSSTQTT
jgi:hypothetical protein